MDRIAKFILPTYLFISEIKMSDDECDYMSDDFLAKLTQVDRGIYPCR